MDNKIAIVSGGTSGVGFSIAKNLSENGFKVIAFGNNPLKIEKANLEHPEICFHKVDIRKEKEVSAFFEYIKEKYKTIDLLINSAGFGLFGKLTTLDDRYIRKCIEVNLLGTIITTKYALSIMEHNMKGQIINIESIAAVKGFAFGTIYSAVKAGIASFSESLWKEYKKKNIRISSIRPGLIDTDFLKKLVKNEELKYALSEEDIVNAVRFIINQSDRSNVSEILIRPLKKEGQDLFTEILNNNFT